MAMLNYQRVVILVGHLPFSLMAISKILIFVESSSESQQGLHMWSVGIP